MATVARGERVRAPIGTPLVGARDGFRAFVLVDLTDSLCVPSTGGRRIDVIGEKVIGADHG